MSRSINSVKIYSLGIIAAIMWSMVSFVNAQEMMLYSNLDSQTDNTSEATDNNYVENKIQNNEYFYTTSTGNTQAAGERLVITNPISGDLIVAGGELVLNADIAQNLIAAGGAIEINGTVSGDILVMGGIIIINGDVKGDVRVFAGDVYVNSGMIEGDLLAFAGQVSFAEKVEVMGEVKIYGGEQKSGYNNIRTGRIDNPTSLRDPKIEAMLDEYIFSGRDLDNGMYKVTFEIIGILSGIVMGYFVIRTFPVFSLQTMSTMKNNGMMSIFVGVMSFVVALFVAFFLMVSVIGIPLLGLLVLLSIIANILSIVFATVLFGKFVISKITKNDNPRRIVVVTTGYVLMGAFGLTMMLLPVLGGVLQLIVRFFMLAWGMGAILINKFNGLKG